MQFSNAPGKIPLPFAASGGKNTIPQASQILVTPGAASLTDGFPPLTRTLISAGGIAPSGLDMNGILYETTAIAQWLNAGAGYKYDSAFSGNSAVGGYPATARVARSDGLGYWLNTVDNNTTDPETSGAAAAGWIPDTTAGSAAITMTNANVTLTPLQYGCSVIVITGTLTANVNLIFPAIVAKWVVINSTTGAYTITAKTAAGTGVAVSGKSPIVGDGTNIYSTAPAAAVSNLFTGGTTTGSANAQVIASLSPATGFSLSNPGDTITCTAGYTNTGATTIAITTPSVGATPLRKNGSSGLVALTGGEIVAGNVITLTVDASSTYLVLDAGLPATLFLQSALNLSDVANPATALSNIGGISSLQMTPFAVGSIALLGYIPAGTLSAGSTTAASNLNSQGFGFGSAGTTGHYPTGDSLTGTWKALQTCIGSGTGTGVPTIILFQRTA